MPIEEPFIVVREKSLLQRLYRLLGIMGGQIWSASEMAAEVVVALNQCLYKLSEPARQISKEGGCFLSISIG